MSTYPSTTATVTITQDELRGVIALGTIATISTVSSSLLLLHLLIIAFASRKGKNGDERIFLRTHLGALVVCLFLSDLIQGLSGMVQIVWASNRQVFTGSFCMTQAVMLHIGDVGTAYWNAVIAIHTFWTVVLGKRTTTAGIATLIVSGWTLCFVFAMLGPFAIQTEERGPFYAIAGVWCFITGNYQYPRIALHYLPMLLSAATITILYVHVALVLFGVLTVDGGTWRLKAPTRKSTSTIRDFFSQFSWGRLHRRAGPAAEEHPESGPVGVSDGSLDRGRKNKCKSLAKPAAQTELSVFENHAATRPLRLRMLGIKMLWYPSVYLVLILPMTIFRIDPSLNINLDVILVFTCLLLFMGTANTVIYLCTRRLGPAPWSRRNVSVSVSVSMPRSRSHPERGHAETTLTQGDISLQIQVEQYTKPATDEQSIDLPRKKSIGNSLTDISSLSSMSPVMRRDGGDGFTPNYGDSKTGFDFTGEKATHHHLRPTPPSGPIVIIGPPQPPMPYLEQQTQYSPQEQERPQEQTPITQHPYSYP